MIYVFALFFAALAALPLGARPLRQEFAPWFEPSPGGFQSMGLEVEARLEASGLTVRAHGRDAFSLNFEGVPGAEPTGSVQLPGVSNYYGDQSNRLGVPHYGRVVYTGVFPGISAVFYTNDRRIEYDLLVSPGADVSRAVFRVIGSNRLSLTPDGNLQIATASGPFTLKAPVAYQGSGANRARVACRYVLSPHFRFEPRVRISRMLVRINIHRGLKAAKTPAED
ncbi:MAG: hypothetical protein FJW30_18385, partial [Acidobacteria bacterium]|nr:hypothetical protein [Acidobacteriota bacterium]